MIGFKIKEKVDTDKKKVCSYNTHLFIEALVKTNVVFIAFSFTSNFPP